MRNYSWKIINGLHILRHHSLNICVVLMQSSEKITTITLVKNGLLIRQDSVLITDNPDEAHQKAAKMMEDYLASPKQQPKVVYRSNYVTVYQNDVDVQAVVHKSGAEWVISTPSGISHPRPTRELAEKDANLILY